MKSLPNRSLLALVLVHALASLVHFVHNATFLADYPNMPAWITPGGVYAVWLGEAAIGAAGVILFLRGGTMIGRALIAEVSVQTVQRWSGLRVITSTG